MVDASATASRAPDAPAPRARADAPPSRHTPVLVWREERACMARRRRRDEPTHRVHEQTEARP